MEGKEVMVTFIVVRSFSPYTAILGRLWIHAMGAVLSTLHVKVKFPTEQGIAVVGRESRLNRRKPPRRHLCSNYRSPEKKWGLVVPRS